MRMRVVGIQKDGRRVMAKEACRKCYGRGYKGVLRAGNAWRVKEGTVPCDCLVVASVSAQHPMGEAVPWWKRWMLWFKKIIGAGEARKRAVRCSTQPKAITC
jgi:hypothetical protein